VKIAFLPLEFTFSKFARFVLHFAGVKADAS